jgi:hypothetical protein
VLWVGAPAIVVIVFFKTTSLYFLSVCESCATNGRSHRGFCFLQRHIVILSECMQVLCYVCTLPQGLSFSSKHALILSQCMQVPCYVWTLTQGLLFCCKHILIFSECIQVLPCGSPGGRFLALQVARHRTSSLEPPNGSTSPVRYGFCACWQQDHPPVRHCCRPGGGSQVLGTWAPSRTCIRTCVGGRGHGHLT